ncbi:MAG: carbonic anhydrase [Planctomycetota bacterium]
MNLKLSVLSALVVAAIGVAALRWPSGPVNANETKSGHPVLAEDVLDILRAGNERYVSGQAEHRNSSPRRVAETAAGQVPFVTVLSCSDSRVPVENVFDRGIGDVFVVRVAGNVSTPGTAGSVEYGVAHLNTPVLVVMGHTSCGAVTAAASGAEIKGPIDSLLAPIRPSVVEAQRKDPRAEGASLVNLAVRGNVLTTIAALLEASPETRARVVDGRCTVVGAVYDLATGRVEWLGEPPAIAALRVSGQVGGPDAPQTSFDATEARVRGRRTTDRTVGTQSKRGH